MVPPPADPSPPGRDSGTPHTLCIWPYHRDGPGSDGMKGGRSPVSPDFLKAGTRPGLHCRVGMSSLCVLEWWTATGGGGVILWSPSQTHRLRGDRSARPGRQEGVAEVNLAWGLQARALHGSLLSDLHLASIRAAEWKASAKRICFAVGWALALKHRRGWELNCSAVC